MSNSFTCPNCGAVSYNPNDVANHYCGGCRKFVDETPRPYYFRDGEIGIISDAPGAAEAIDMWPDLNVKTLAEWKANL